MKKLIDYLFDKGMIEVVGNVYYAEKAFKLNSVMSICLKEENPEKIEKYLIVAKNFLAGTIDISLENDKLVVTSLKSINNRG
tara:strand:+ start:625 stop:870 length:246 start_codon:yes stop_codon:yes gene_type:complete